MATQLFQRDFLFRRMTKASNISPKGPEAASEIQLNCKLELKTNEARGELAKPRYIQIQLYIKLNRNLLKLHLTRASEAVKPGWPN